MRESNFSQKPLLPNYLHSNKYTHFELEYLSFLIMSIHLNLFLSVITLFISSYLNQQYNFSSKKGMYISILILISYH